MKRFFQAISLVVIATGFSVTIAACGKKTEVKSCSEFNNNEEKCKKAEEAGGKACKYTKETNTCAAE